MSEPLLEVSRLTLRFGGLTAVQDVDLRVGTGEVLAVIGPNGAGKTSLFNTISGIYAPTQGQIHFARRPLVRALTGRAVAWFALTGLTFGVVLMLFAANVDRMWAVVVKRNFVFGQGFDTAQALRDAQDYLRAAPFVEHRMGRYHVVSHDGKTSYGTTHDAQAAQAIHTRIYDDALQAGDGARRTRWLALALGVVAGTGGAYAVWQQSRRTATWIARQGIARTFQNNRLFGNLSVLDNVMVALDRHNAAPLWSAVWPPVALQALLLACALGVRFAWPSMVPSGALAFIAVGCVVYMAHLWRVGGFSTALRFGQTELWAEALTWLTFVGLKDKADDTAASLAYGDQRRLEIARALATRPKLLLLDEPAAGMNPTETRALMALIRAIRDRGIAVLLIEHDMKLVMEVSSRIAVLEYGRKIADADPTTVRNDPRVIAAYLGAPDPVQDNA